MNITLIADFTCPFSYIGKRRLDEAIAESNEPIHVTLQAFQLTPDAPTDKSIPTVELLAKKFNKTSSVLISQSIGRSVLRLAFLGLGARLLPLICSIYFQMVAKNNRFHCI